jgi:hypothetical protein
VEVGLGVGEEVGLGERLGEVEGVEPMETLGVGVGEGDREVHP